MASNMDRLAGKIAIKKSHQGLLHQNLGVPQGQKIPVSRMRSAANSGDPALARRAQFALNARQWNH